MRRWDPEVWAGLLGTGICVAAGLPVLVARLQGQDVTVGPAWLWAAVFVGFVVALVVSTWFSEAFRPVVGRGVYALAVALAGVAVLLAPGTGWTPIILVFTAALGCYLVPRAATVAVVALNTVVVTVSAALSSGSPGAGLVTGGVYLLLQVLSVLGVVVQQREAAARQELALAHTELAAATALLAEQSRVQERLRIARELHDLVGHQLTALTLELEVATHSAPGAAAEHVARARAVARDLLGDVRTAVGELRTRAPDLRATLDRLAAEVPAPAVHVRVGDDVVLDEERTTVLVRCVQEAVTNAIRHAAATHLWVDVAGRPEGTVRLTVRDDGAGTDGLVLGNGLRGMTERVAGVGGSVRFEPDGGFRVVAEVPAS